ncbi:hypothetical protein DN826_17780 [Stutzerimonas nosocomialis]|nr:hypothetical protein DN826_17780 [Stutzerimonas nosocomialis]
MTRCARVHIDSMYVAMPRRLAIHRSSLGEGAASEKRRAALKTAGRSILDLEVQISAPKAELVEIPLM